MSPRLLLLRLQKLKNALTSRRTALALSRHGVLAASEHFPIIPTDFASLVDVGANRGQFSLAFRARSPKGIIHAFEPLDEPAQVFSHVFAGDERAVLHPFAIGPRSERLSIHVSKRDDSSSLLPIGKLQTENFPGTDESHCRSVEVRRLSEVLNGESLLQPSFLKN